MAFSMAGGEPLWHVPQWPPNVRLGALHDCMTFATGGSRERLNALFVFWASVRWNNRATAGQNIALGN